MVEVFDERPQAVAMGNDDDLFARAHLWRDFHLPVRHHTQNRVLETLSEWQFLGQEGGVTRIECRDALVVTRQSRRRNIVTATPNMHLLVAKFCRSFRLVEAF